MYEVGVWPRALPDPAETAEDFAEVTQLNSAQVLGQIQAASPGQFLTLLSLDPDDYAQISPEAGPGAWSRRAPGQPAAVLFRGQRGGRHGRLRKLQPAARRGPLLPARHDHRPDRPAGRLPATAGRRAPTTEVVAENASGAQVAVLQQWRGKAGQPVQTTINAQVQAAALSAMGAAPDASAEIVAVQASTGKLLAVAGQSAPGGGLPSDAALNARLSPGTAFTIVSTAALLGTGFSPVPRSPVPAWPTSAASSSATSSSRPAWAPKRRSAPISPRAAAPRSRGCPGG